MDVNLKWWAGQVVVAVVMVCLGVAGVWQQCKRFEAYGYRQGVLYMQREAVQQKHAEYFLDELNELAWRWK